MLPNSSIDHTQLITKSHPLNLPVHLHMAITKEKTNEKNDKHLATEKQRICYQNKEFKLATRCLWCMGQGHCKNPHGTDAHSTNYCIMGNPK